MDTVKNDVKKNNEVNPVAGAFGFLAGMGADVIAIGACEILLNCTNVGKAMKLLMRFGQIGIGVVVGAEVMDKATDIFDKAFGNAATIGEAIGKGFRIRKARKDIEKTQSVDMNGEVK